MISTLMVSLKRVYCTDVAGLRLSVGLPAYHSSDWRLYIDSSKRSPKCVLLHSGNKYGSSPTGHSVVLKNYSNIKVVLERLKYCDHQWPICVDLKMVNFYQDNKEVTSNIPNIFMLVG